MPRVKPITNRYRMRILSHWLLKAVGQGMVSLLPLNQRWNKVIGRYITRSSHLQPTRFIDKLLQTRKHLENYQAFAGGRKRPATVVELGTGWHPIIPLGFYLCGISTSWTIDQTSLLLPSTVEESIRLFIRYAERGKLRKILPQIQEDRIGNLTRALRDIRVRGPIDVLKRFNIEAVVDDARHTRLKTASIDLIISNNTLEHIPEATLKDIFMEFKRLGAGRSVMSHFVDMSDHYAHFDRSISPYNFLRFSDPVWRLFNNSLQYQNRLRISDYRNIHHDAGFAIVGEDITSGSSDQLQKVPLAKKFQRYSRDELLITHSWMASISKNG